MRAANNNRRHPPPTEPTSSSSSDNDVDVAIRRELSEMGVDVYEPLSRHEEDLAHSFGRFSDYVLREGGGGRDACLGILEDDLRRGGSSVGELQGGSDEYPIYRVSFPPSSSSEGGGGSSGGHSYRGGGARTTRGGGENKGGKSSPGGENNAATRLLDHYNHNCGGGRKSSPLTLSEIERYMLGMCHRRARERDDVATDTDRLGNLMLVMQFGGPTPGQVRHTDDTMPNVQICMYMSHDCPSTIVYAMDDDDGEEEEDEDEEGGGGGGSPVTDGASLAELWRRKRTRGGRRRPNPRR